MKKAIAAAVLLITLTLCFLLVVHVLRAEAINTAHGTIDIVKEVLNITPEVTITTYVTKQKNNDILELASTSKAFPVEYSKEFKYLGSTKRLSLLGQYTVKAGFDFHDHFAVQIDQVTHRVRADFPAPKILSVQQEKYTVTEAKDGMPWNTLTQKDQATAVNEMNDQARKTALTMNVLEEAKNSLRRQLLDLAKKTGQDWEITFRDEQYLSDTINTQKL